MNDQTSTTTSEARLRFWGSLNDFLKRADRDTPVPHRFNEAAAVKDVIEALGVPHPEVDLIVADGRALPFGYLVQPGDTIEVFPVGTAHRPPALAHASLRPVPAPRFVLDQHLGTLARYLRMLGFDTWYRNDYHDAELAHIAGTTERILLTRDRPLLKRGAVLHGYYVRTTDPRQQVAEILDRFDLHDVRVPFGRCTRCNGELEIVAKSEIEDQLPPKTRVEFDEFRRCMECGQVYWAGSHFEAMRRFMDSLSPTAERGDAQ